MLRPMLPLHRLEARHTLTWLNGYSWCGFPLRPTPGEELTRARGDWAMQILAKGMDVVIGSGLVRTYNGSRHVRLDGPLRGSCKDFAGRYVLARLSEPYIQLHDVVSPLPLNQRMEWLTKILETRSHRNGPYVLATDRFSMFGQQRPGSVLLKNPQARCGTTLKAPEQTEDWLRFATVRSAQQFIKKIEESC